MNAALRELVLETAANTTEYCASKVDKSQDALEEANSAIESDVKAIASDVTDIKVAVAGALLSKKLSCSPSYYIFG